MVSTGRHHGFESLAEQRLLLGLDFAGEVLQVLGQPFRLRYTTSGQVRDHIPDVLAVTAHGVWLFDVRPADRVRTADLPGFAAAAQVAAEVGWRYAVATGWRPHVLAGVEALSAQRRPLHDPLGLQEQLLAAADRLLPFGELVAATSVPAVGRAHALHLLWHRRLEVDLGRPVGDAALVRPSGMSAPRSPSPSPHTGHAHHDHLHRHESPHHHGQGHPRRREAATGYPLRRRTRTLSSARRLYQSEKHGRRHRRARSRFRALLARKPHAPSHRRDLDTGSDSSTFRRSSPTPGSLITSAISPPSTLACCVDTPPAPSSKPPAAASGLWIKRCFRPDPLGVDPARRVP